MTTGASVPQGDLARLLETERRLEERLRAARAEGEQMVAQAQTAAEGRERALADEIEHDQRALAETLEAERRQGERDIADAAEREAAAFEAIAASRVAAVARELALRFFAGKAAP